MSARSVRIRDLLVADDSGQWGDAPRGSDADVGVLRVGNIANDGRIDLTDVARRTLQPAQFGKIRLLAGDILLERSGGSDNRPVGRVAYVPNDTALAFTNFLQRLRANRDIVEPEYLFYLLLHLHQKGRTVALQTQTTGIRNLTYQRYLSETVRVPAIGKQRRILSALRSAARMSDGYRRIALLQRTNKSVSARKLLSGNVWDGRPLSEVVARVTRRNSHHDALVLTCSGEHGLIDQKQFFSKTVAGDSREEYFLLRRGEFAYNRSAMSGYPYGAVKRLDTHDAGALSTLNICFALRGDAWLSDFAVHVFESGVLNHQLGRIARVGSRAHGLLNVTKADFFALQVPVPPREEQRLIADFLNALDREIALLEQLRDAYAAQKRGLMQRLLAGDVTLAADAEPDAPLVNV